MPPDAAPSVPDRTVVLREVDGEGLELAEILITSRGSSLVLAFPGARRILLGPGCRISELTSAELATVLAGACRLTLTEAVFTAPDGGRWLAQAVGPVWAGSEAAEGLVGTMFTSIDGGYERFEVRGSPLRPGGEDGQRLQGELQELWKLGRGPEERTTG